MSEMKSATATSPLNLDQRVVRLQIAEGPGYLQGRM